MPQFKPPRRGVTLSEALHEAASIAPVRRAMLSTFELYHPVGTPDGPIYVVNNRVAISAYKEDDAARDPGAQVEFMAAGVRIERPDENPSTASPELTLTVAQVSGFMSDALRAARGSIVAWEIIERLYASDELNAPAMTPLRLLVIGVDITAEFVTLRCSYGDPANVSVPTQTFRRPEYPGLVR